MIVNSATAAEQQPAVALLQLNGLLLLDLSGGMTFFYYYTNITPPTTTIGLALLRCLKTEEREEGE